MFVGRIDRNKNLQLIAQALRIIQTRRPGNEIVVDIIGKGAEYENVSRLASELGVGHQMNQIGYIHNEQLRDYYEKGYAVILPSFSETLGKVILEAYTVGTPAIASNVGGIPDLVQDGVNGYLIDPHDATQLADRMLAMIDSPEAYRQMQISATGTAHKWTREVSLQHWLKTLSEVISKFSKR